MGLKMFEQIVFETEHRLSISVKFDAECPIPNIGDFVAIGEWLSHIEGKVVARTFRYDYKAIYIKLEA